MNPRKTYPHLDDKIQILLNCLEESAQLFVTRFLNLEKKFTLAEWDNVLLEKLQPQEVLALNRWNNATGESRAFEEGFSIGPREDLLAQSFILYLRARAIPLEVLKRLSLCQSLSFSGVLGFTLNSLLLILRSKRQGYPNTLKQLSFHNCKMGTKLLLQMAKNLPNCTSLEELSLSVHYLSHESTLNFLHYWVPSSSMRKLTLSANSHWEEEIITDEEVLDVLSNFLVKEHPLEFLIIQDPLWRNIPAETVQAHLNKKGSNELSRRWVVQKGNSASSLCFRRIEPQAVSTPPLKSAGQNYLTLPQKNLKYPELHAELFGKRNEKDMAPAFVDSERSFRILVQGSFLHSNVQTFLRDFEDLPTSIYSPAYGLLSPIRNLYLGSSERMLQESLEEFRRQIIGFLNRSIILRKLCLQDGTPGFLDLDAWMASIDRYGNDQVKRAWIPLLNPNEKDCIILQPSGRKNYPQKPPDKVPEVITKEWLESLLTRKG